jgi:hypothetical protein
LLDEAVDALPDGVRDAIILHFLKSFPQSEVADRLGVHQSTVSRRVSEGLKLLHDRLRDSGVVLSATPLAALLAANAAQPETPDLAASLGKIALVGAGSGAAGKVVTWLGVSLSLLKSWGLLAGAAVLPVVVQLIAGGWHGFLAAILTTAYIAWRRPALIAAISPLGRRVYDSPFYPWKRWTWTTPPLNWRGMLAGSLAAAAMLGIMGWAVSQGPNPTPGYTALFTAFALVQLGTAARIGVRVRRWEKTGREDEPAEIPNTPDLVTVIQGVTGTAAMMLMAACCANFHVRVQSPTAVALGMVLPIAISAVWGSVDAIRNLFRYLRDAATPSDGDDIAPRSSQQALVLYLFVVVIFTASAMVEALQIAPVSPAYARTPEGVMRHGVTVGVLPSIALFFLNITIRPLARLHGAAQPAVWLFALAVAVLCGILDLGLCIAWLMPRP